MQQHEHDNDLEKYLKRFQPRSVRPLEVPWQSGALRFWGLALAATVVLAGGVALWYAPHQQPGLDETRTTHDVRTDQIQSRTRISTLALTQLAFDDSKSFDAVVTSQSQRMFPSMRGERSALQVLAKP